MRDAPPNGPEEPHGPTHGAARGGRTVQGVRFALIVLAGTIVSILLHQVRHDPLATLTTRARSAVITSGYFPPVALGALLVAFGIIGALFLAIQKALPGTKQSKGARFGIALGGMYLVGMIEAYVVYPVPLLGEVYTGVADGAGILLMCLLLGRRLADDSPVEDGGIRRMFPAILSVPLAYVLLRYLAYAVLHIESSYATRPLATLAWTTAMGCWAGVMFALVGRPLRVGGRMRRAAVFGGFVFGANWLIYNLFVLLFIVVPVWDLVGRALIDTLAVTVGASVTTMLGRDGSTTLRAA